MALTVQVAGVSYTIDEPAFKYSPKLAERWKCQIYIWDYTGLVFFCQVGKEDEAGVVPNINLAFPALCELGGILEGRLVNRIGHAGYLNCQSHGSTPLNRPAVPAHVCTCPLHDLVGHTRAV